MKKGDRVLINNASRLDHAFQGMTGEFIEYTGNGYARILLDKWKEECADRSAKVLVHPESVELLPA